MAEVAIAAAGLAKRFTTRGWRPGRHDRAVDALRGLDLEVGTGAVHAVIGPNGSGKSTLLRVLATLVVPDGGSASVGGADVVDAPLEVRRCIGFSTGEERSVYWRLTARQNLEFAAALHHLAEPKAHIAAALAAARLDDVADRPVRGYSQGMARRLGLARALLHAPPVLLLDEPTRSLDPVARGEFHDVLRRLRDRAGTTVLLTTHDLDEAASLADAVTVLRAGRSAGVVPAGDAAALEAHLRAADRVGA